MPKQPAKVKYLAIRATKSIPKRQNTRGYSMIYIFEYQIIMTVYNNFSRKIFLKKERKTFCIEKSCIFAVRKKRRVKSHKDIEKCTQ